MESIEELKARHAKEMQRLESEQALAALAPIPPRRAMLVSTGEKAWLTYEAADLWAALDIMAKFEPLAFYKFKGTYTRFEPEAQNDKRTRDKGEETGGPFVALIDVNHGEGFGPCVCLAFFAYLGADICKIKVDLRPEGYRPASWWQYGPRFQADSSGRGRRLDGNRYVQGDWRANEKLYGMTDSCVTWGSGSPESTHYTFAIMADNEGAGGLAEWQEARLRLENLALALHGERKAESE